MDLLETLVSTGALRIAPPGQVFWYTSGTVGPYYIDTHYLFGGPERAEELLAFIDAGSRAADFHGRLRERVSARVASDPAYAAVIDALAASILGREPEGGVDWISGGERRDWFFSAQLASDPGYAAVIDALVVSIRSREPEGGVDSISGGERRDWFFSAAVALRSGRPHLYIYKDWAVLLAEGDRVTEVEDLGGRRTAHVADLVTEASSYERAWIPALRGRGGDMAVSANVVDRGQGGMEVIAAAGVDAEACLSVDEAMFADLLGRGLVGEAQHALLVDYFRDPAGAMRRFLVGHPAFLQDALASGEERTAERARMLVERDPYGLRDGG